MSTCVSFALVLKQPEQPVHRLAWHYARGCGGHLYCRRLAVSRLPASSGPSLGLHSGPPVTRNSSKQWFSGSEESHQPGPPFCPPFHEHDVGVMIECRAQRTRRRRTCRAANSRGKQALFSSSSAAVGRRAGSTETHHASARATAGGRRCTSTQEGRGKGIGRTQMRTNTGRQCSVAGRQRTTEPPGMCGREVVGEAGAEPVFDPSARLFVRPVDALLFFLADRVPL